MSPLGIIGACRTSSRECVWLLCTVSSSTIVSMVATASALRGLSSVIDMPERTGTVLKMCWLLCVGGCTAHKSDLSGCMLGIDGAIGTAIAALRRQVLVATGAVWCVVPPAQGHLLLANFPLAALLGLLLWVPRCELLPEGRTGSVASALCCKWVAWTSLVWTSLRAYPQVDGRVSQASDTQT